MACLPQHFLAEKLKQSSWIPLEHLVLDVVEPIPEEKGLYKDLQFALYHKVNSQNRY